jgi:integrase
VLTVHQVYALADAIESRYRALVLLATFASLRWAELAALTPQDIDLAACTVRVTRQINYPPGGGHTFGPPKSRAGRRVVSFPHLIVPDLRTHLDGLGPLAALRSPVLMASHFATATSTAAPGCPCSPLPAWLAPIFTT